VAARTGQVTLKLTVLALVILAGAAF